MPVPPMSRKTAKPGVTFFLFPIAAYSHAEIMLALSVAAYMGRGELLLIEAPADA
jgi:hypothetical protein